MRLQCGDVIVVEAEQLERADVVEHEHEDLAAIAHVLPLKAHHTEAALIDLGKAQRVDLTAVRDAHKPASIRRWVKQQFHERARVAFVGEADAALRAVDEPVPREFGVLGGHLLAGVVDRGVVVIKTTILTIDNGPHAQRVRGLACAAPQARHTHTIAPRRAEGGAVGVGVADGVLLADIEIVRKSAHETLGVRLGIGFALGGIGSPRDLP